LAWKKKNPPTEEFPDGLPVAEHACTINHNGSSSSMEPKAAICSIGDIMSVSIEFVLMIMPVLQLFSNGPMPTTALTTIHQSLHKLRER
jgi:hypothetical protein